MKLAIASATAAATLWAVSPAPAAIVYSTVALTGTDGTYGPGEGPGVTFFSLTSVQPAINNSGQVAFRGQDSTTGNPNGLWLRTGNANALLGINGGPLPGGGTYPTGPSALFNTYILNNAGQTAWRLGASTAAFSTTPGSPARFVYPGDNAPGTTTSGPLATFSGVSSGMPLLNQSGSMAVMASLNVNASLTPPVTIASGVINSAGIWTGTPGNQQLVLRQNDTLNSLDATGNTRVGTMQNLGFVFNGNGSYAVVTALQGSNVVTGTGATSNSQIIATNRSGSFEAAARAGSPAPDAAGIPSVNLYRSIANSAPGFNDFGHVAFSSSLRDSAGVQTNAGALFTDAGSGTLRTVAKATDAMPTIYSRTGSALSEFNGVTWGSTYSNPLLNGTDQLLVAASGWGNTGGQTNNSGLLLLDTAGLWHKIERNGDVAITGGAPNGTDAFFSSTSSVQMNAAGQIAFMSNLTGVNVSVGAGNGSALWISDPDGTLTKIARTNDSFEVAPGDI
ncbi:MAG TPA: choice-of-anchor tandem repeat NxxGxxAF-containing protein, partial [Tepidisphaeraceae bacterium]